MANYSFNESFFNPFSFQGCNKGMPKTMKDFAATFNSSFVLEGSVASVNQLALQNIIKRAKSG